MGRWNSRRAGPEHPLLFVDARDIPVVVEPPAPRAADALAPYAALLDAADAERLDGLGARDVGRRVVVGAERRPAEALLGGDALLDDGTAVVPLHVRPQAPRGLRDALTARLVLVRGVVTHREGRIGLEADDAADLRALARARGGARR